MVVRSQEEMANPQGVKVFTVERNGLHGDFVCVDCTIIVATRICAESADCLRFATVIGPGRVSVL